MEQIGSSMPERNVVDRTTSVDAGRHAINARSPVGTRVLLNRELIAIACLK
jgi:hypothetical protein